MKKSSSILVLAVCAILFGCSKSNTLEGLWEVKTVMIDGQEQTPNGKWTRFHADGTQESGNGWLQHSVGTYNFDEVTKTISVVNDNGLIDPAPPFTVDLKENEMHWKRTEEGHEVEVILERTDELPKTYGNDLLGLWQMESSEGNGPFLSADMEQALLFVRWDGRFDVRSANGRVRGVYNVNGHRPEVELIPYGENRTRSFWDFDCTQNELTMTLLNSDTTVTRSFKRIHAFPE